MSRLFAKKEQGSCCICLKEVLEQPRVTRNTKKDNWICCDCCKSWFHASCGGFTQAQYNKISRENIWIKCVVCCLQQIRSANSDEDSTSVSDLITAISRTEGASDGKKDKRRKSCGTVGDLDKSLGKVVKLSDKQKQGTATVVDDSRPSESLASGVPLSEEQQPAVNLDVQSAVDNILIIDNINNPSEFSSSKRILKEVNCYCPTVKVEFAYSLAKGGVAIHTSNGSDRDTLLNGLPRESFGGGIKHPPKCSPTNSVFLKGVDTSVDLSQVKQCLHSRGVTILEARRLTNRFTGKPTRVIKVRCSEESVKCLLNLQISINNKVCVVEQERQIRVIRCFNCQSLGHIAKFCTNLRRCEFCAGSHGNERKCEGQISCVNCGGSHPASSSHCSAYISRYESLAKQCPERRYVSSTASSYFATSAH